MHQPSLLIVVPTLDSHLLLPRLLSSLQQQTWPDWRLLFIDGPSGPDHRHWLIQCCSEESRCNWVEQDPHRPGIFGAMNQGFALASPEDWLLFWGSDDWAASPHVLSRAIRAIKAANRWPDLMVCQGRYADTNKAALGRSTRFQSAGTLSSAAYSRALFLGSTPPHQATLFGPDVRSKLARYTLGFRLSADLDYFLELSRHSDLHVMCIDLVLVFISDGGVSGKFTQLRLQEVRHAYRRAYGSLWWLPYLGRYLRRTLSLTRAFVWKFTFLVQRRRQGKRCVNWPK
jgi:glycosyltransferase involved in cell wall biosynthesis